MALKKMYDEDEDKKPSPFKKIPLYDAGGEAGGGQAATGAQASGSGETASEGSATDAIASLGAGTGDNQSGETTKPENWATKQIHAMGKSKSPAYFANVPTGNTYHAPDWHVNLYDHGGEVNTNNAMPADRGAKIFVMGRADGGNGSRVNLYDEGGEATVQGIGGQAIPADATLPPDHQVAVIEDGERVLTPAETAAYDVEHPQEAAMHAAPTETLNWEPERGFGKAMPNEGVMAGANVKPLPGQVNIPTPVAEANTDNTINMLDKAPKVPTHPPTTPTKINLGGEEYNAQLSEDAAKNTGKFIKGEPIENAPDPTGAMKEIFQQQKEKAAMSGNLLDMGKALIAEKQFTKADMPQYGGPGLVSGRTGEAVTPDDSKIKQVGKENYGDKIAMYKKAYQSALDEFTPEGQKRAAGIKEAMLNYEKEHPYGAQESAHPGIGGKILHGLSQVGQIAGEALGEGPVLAQIPGTQLNRKAEENRALGMGKEASAEEAQAATTAETQARTKQLLNPEHNWEPMAGEQFTEYEVNPDGSQGTPLAQLFRNKVTNQTEWRPLPAAQGAPAAAAQPGAAPGAAGGVQYGTRQATKPAERLLDDAGVSRMDNEAKEAANRLPSGYDAVPPKFDKTDTGASAKAKMDQYTKAINDQLANYKRDQNELNIEQRQKAAADLKERKAQEKNDGYVDKADGTGVHRTNEYDARNNPAYIGATFEAMKPGDEKKDKDAMKMLGIIQGSTNDYTNSARTYADAQNNGTFTHNGKPISDANPIPVSGFLSMVGLNGSLTDQKEVADQDRKNIAAIFTKSGWGEFNASISAGGHVDIPVITAFGESLSKQLNSKWFNELSDQGKQMVLNYRAQLAAVPAYIKAVSGIGRQNKETLDLELANILDPTHSATDILTGQERWQRNLDRANGGFPDNYPGIKNPAQTQPKEEKPKGEIPPVVKGMLNNPFPRVKGAPAAKPSAGQGGTAPKNPFRQ